MSNSMPGLRHLFAGASRVSSNSCTTVLERMNPLTEPLSRALLNAGILYIRIVLVKPGAVRIQF